MISVNGTIVRPDIFPDGTSQVWKLPEALLQAIYRDNEARVAWEFEAEAELLWLAQLKVLLDTYTSFVYLYMPYLPFGRQDKRVENQSTFALTAFARLLNTLNFLTVTVLDAHNNSRAHAINGLEDLSPRSLIENAWEKTGANLLLYPDAGAKLRYEAYKIGPSVCADKVRDQSTGNILKVTINGSVKSKRVLIVDDLCDGGMTFCLVAWAALALGAMEIHLYTTHGLYSKGVTGLRDAGIQRIFNRKGEVQ